MPTIENPYTEEQYLALTAAIASGSLEVEYGDKKVKYRSLDEMIQILGLMEASLNVNNQNNGRRVGDYHSGL